MDIPALNKHVDQTWNNEIIPELIEYIKIPNKSPAFDKDWKANGYMDKAAKQIHAWCDGRIEGMTCELLELDGMTPLIYMEIPGQIDETVLLYGHLDKQPEMTGWHPDLGPWKPVLKGSRLYGRGGADDGYAAYASLTAIEALQKQGIPHARCVVLIEASEEGGSHDLPAYVDHLKDRIGTPGLVICLDSGCGDYEHLWNTTSLRGMTGGELRVDILEQGVHSGLGTGIVPSSFRIMRELLARIEDQDTGEILIPECHVEIPKQRIEQAEVTAGMLQDVLLTGYTFVKGSKPVHPDTKTLLLNRTWMPTLEVTGVDGIPSLDSAGNVLRPYTTLTLSFRLPPTCDAKKAGAAIKHTLENNPPHGAKVTYTLKETENGWNAPELAPWLADAIEFASQQIFSEPCAHFGEGGTIPFMGMLGDKFPDAQFFIAGVLGPNSNAHGPNEFLDIPMGKAVTAAVSHVLVKHFEHHNK